MADTFSDQQTVNKDVDVERGQNIYAQICDKNFRFHL